MARRGALLVVALLLLAGCQVRTNVTVSVNDDGSGNVQVNVGVDDDGLKKAPEFTQVRTDDLTAAGWKVTGPKREGDGFTWFHAQKPFATPEEATRILNEVSGAGGPFRDFVLARERSFAKTDFRFDGTIDLTGGLAAFSDSALVAQLDGKPLGEDAAAISERIGQPLDDVFHFSFVVVLPGPISSNAPQQFGHSAAWQPKLSDRAPVAMHATSTARRWLSLIGLAIIAVAVLGLIVWTAKRWRGENLSHPLRKTGV